MMMMMMMKFSEFGERAACCVRVHRCEFNDLCGSSAMLSNIYTQ